MQTGRLILLLLLVLVVAVAVFLLLRRSAARKEQRRVEAAVMRTDADQIAARLAGQTSFAQQAAERAEVARVEAEQRAREAARLEEEAAQQRAAAEATRQEYEQTMRRADEVDPDVTESSFPAVDEADSRGGDTPAVDRTASDDDVPGPADDDVRRVAGDDGRTASDDDVLGPADDDARRTAGERPGAAAGAHAAGVGAAGAGAAGAGAALWADRDSGRHPESERIASAADYRDDTGDVGPERDVSDGVPVGRAGGMSDDARPDREDLESGREGERPATSLDSDTSHDVDADASHDVESPRGEWGGPPQDGPADEGADMGADRGADERADMGADRGADQGAGMSVIAEPEDYAATEPVLAEDQTPPVERASVSEEERPRSAAAGVDRDTDADAGADHGADAGADRDADAGADHGADAGADLGSSTADTGDMAIIADPDQYASTEPVSATEGDVPSADSALVDDRDHSAGARDRLTEEHTSHGTSDLADPGAHAPAESGAAVAENDDSTWTAADDAERATAVGGDRPPARDWAADEGELLEQTHDRGDRLAEERHDLARESGTLAPESTAQRAARRISDFHELRDGGYGVGSAAPLDDGAQPLDHPIQGHRDSMSFHLPGDPGYDTAEPDVWFYDEGAAQRAGFRRSGG